MKQILVYRTANGKCPYEDWLYGLDKTNRVRIEKRFERVQEGNYGDFKKINSDISEFRFTFGGGYRVYFSEINNIIIILLCAGNKSSQTEDIKRAKEFLEDLIKRNK